MGTIVGKTETVLSWIEDFGRGARLMFALSVVLFCALMVEYVVFLNTEQIVDRERAATVEYLSTIRARLEGEVNSTLYLSRGMVSYVATHPDLTWNDFEPLAAEMLAVGQHIRNIGLAPDNIIQFIYPLAGNERALGMDYRNNEQQWPSVERAIAAGNTIVAGPVELVQGGQALIARTPIFIQDRSQINPGLPKYWGLTAVVIDISSFFGAAGIQNTNSEWNLAIRGKDGLGENGETFLGDAALFEQDGAITQVVSLPGGTWQLAAIPAAGWGASESPQIIVRTIGWLIALIFGVLVFLLLSLERRNRELALHDHLTQLPNRRLMYDRLYQLAALSDRSKFGFTLLYMDLNGFKPINDEFGHNMGDKVLVETGERLMALTRKSDTVARVGGDEFIVVLPGVTDLPTLDGVLRKLHDGIGQPMKFGDQELVVHASIGCARFPDDADDVDRLVNLADKNMYQDKPSRVTNLHVVDNDG